MNSQNFLGGLVGDLYSESRCLNCYSIGTNKVKNQTVQGNLIGGAPENHNKSDRIVNCYALSEVYQSILPGTDTSVIITNSGIKTTAEMKTQEFVNLLNAGQEDNPWTMDTKGINQGYPVLKWQYEGLK